MWQRGVISAETHCVGLRVTLTLWRVDTVLVIHIALGAAALITGPIAMVSGKRRGLHTRVGEAYHWLVLGTCVAAAALAVMNWSRIWWFLPVAAGSYTFALIGYVSGKRRWPGWLSIHIAGQGGSYIALVTAVLVVNWRIVFGAPGIASPAAWILPTVIGSPIIGFVIAKRQQKPQRRTA